MDSKVPRRTLLKTLTSALAVGSTACQNQPQSQTPPPSAAPAKPVATSPLPLPRVNLICHGMLLFWQDKTNPKSGITIYAPDTMGSHEIRLSTVVGGLPNLLTSQAGTYSLQFGNSAASTHGPMDKTKNAVFYDDPAHPKGLAINTSHAPFQITVPYPTRVLRHRLMDFPAGMPPYDPAGAAVTDFGVTPVEMAGVYMLTWDNVDSAITLKKGSGSPTTIAPTDTPLLNLLLYHCPKLSGSTSHLPHFNALLKYNNHSQLDLTVKNNTPAVTPKENEMVEMDINVLDTWDVQELESKRGADPVGCLQGWGC